MNEAASLNKFEKYQDNLRKKDWNELGAERELRRVKERDLYSKKYDMPPVPSIQAKVSKNANIKAPLAVKMQPIAS